jgi:CDP-4-dehydro-6-deoxyglucose reductase
MPEFSNNFPIKMLPAKIENIHKIGTVAIIKLKLPANQDFKYEPGQYIDIMYEGKARSYSIANGKVKDGCIELHIRYHSEGFFSEIVWHKLAVNQIIRIKGPMGSFNLHNGLGKVLMVCTGTGFAPIKAIVEKMIEDNDHRQITLVWGGASAEDFYLPEILLTWQSKLNITIQLCLDSTALPNYYTGFVTDFIKENFINLSTHEVYACGNPVMIEALYKLATMLELDKQYFYSDSFTLSS